MENQNARQYGISGAAGGDDCWRTQGNNEEEFQESDVWELNRMVDRVSLYLDRKKVDSNNYNNVPAALWDLTTTTAEQKRQPVGLLSRRLARCKTTLTTTTTTVMSIPAATQTGEEEIGKLVHSAPVNVPDWSKIYGRRPRKKSTAFYAEEGVTVSEESDEDDNGEEEWSRRSITRSLVPPHEWLAKKEMIRSKTMSPSSVSEGIGRTLYKG